MITRFPRRGYHRPLETLTHHELYRYAQRGEAEALEVEQALERRRVLRAEGEERLRRSRLESMTRDELRDHARSGRAEDLEAARELLIRHHRRSGDRALWDAPNVVPFRNSTSDNGGVA